MRREHLNQASRFGVARVDAVLAVVFFATALLGSCAAPRPAAMGTGGERGVHRLTIIHTNDHHGHAWAFKDRDCERVGGLAARATLIRFIRARAERQGGGVLVLSAGDVNTGEPASDLAEAKPDFEGMGLAGYDAMTCGNHEFDGTAERWETQLARSPFPILCANVTRRDGTPVGRDHLSVTVGGLRVGIVGVVTADTPLASTPDLWRDTYRLADPIETAARIGERLRHDHDVVIALVHLGVHRDADAETRHPGAISLARRTHAFDAIIDGHSHTLLREPLIVDGTPIVQAGSLGRYLGRLDLDVKEGRVSVAHYAILSVNAADPETGECPEHHIREAADVEKRLAGYRDAVAALIDQPIAVVDTRLLGGAAGRGRETNLGDLVADALRDAGGAEVGLVNSGGLRSDIPAGEATYGDVQRALPFRDVVVLARLKGATLQALLDRSAASVAGDGGFLQVSGLRFRIREGRALDIVVGGAPLDPERIYTVATTNFLSKGGDGYEELAQALDITSTDSLYADVVRRFMKRLGHVHYEVGRRIILR